MNNYQNIDFTRYPFLANEPNMDIHDISDTLLYDVGEGWSQTMIDGCEKIAVYLENHNLPFNCLSFVDIKEKYGTLRIYFEFNQCLSEKDYNSISGIVHDIENTTASLCFECGKPAEYLSAGYILPYCRKCAKKNNDEANERHKTKIPFNSFFTKISCD